MKIGWGGGISLGIYAEVIVHKVYAENHPQLPTAHVNDGEWHTMVHLTETMMMMMK